MGPNSHSPTVKKDSWVVPKVRGGPGATFGTPSSRMRLWPAAIPDENRISAEKTPERPPASLFIGTSCLDSM